MVIVPIFREDDRAEILEAASAVADELRAAGVRVKVKLKASRRLVGKAKKFSVKLLVTATDAAGNRKQVTKTLKVKVKRR